MLTDLLFILILFSGVFAGILFTNHRFEDILPLSSMGIILISFVLTFLSGSLLVGVVGVIVVYVILPVVGLIRARKKGIHIIGTIKENLITPAFFLFLVLFLILSYLNNGRLATGYDEFTHWLDTVKAMVTVNDFSTNPNAHESFGNYPPGMAVFQTFFQYLYQWTHPGKVISEWRCFLAYQVLFISLWMPFLRKLRFRRPVDIILVTMIVLLYPLLIFGDLYMTLYIDPFLGVAGGCGMAYLWIKKEKDKVDLLYISMLCMVLTLSKDVGLMISMFIAITYVLETWIGKRNLVRDKEMERKKKWFAFAKPLMIPLIAYLPRLLWDIQLKKTGWFVAAVPVRMGTFLNILLLGGEDSVGHREGVVQRFSHEFYSWKFEFGSVTLSYAQMTILFALLLVLIAFLYQKRIRRDMGRYILIIAMSYLFLLIYMIGVGALYISRYTEQEAYALASYTRYMGIGYAVILGMIVLPIVYALQQSAPLEAMVEESLLGMLLLCTEPTNLTQYFLTRESVREAEEFRLGTYALQERIDAIPEDDAEIYLLSQGSGDLEYLIYHYQSRPKYVKGGGSFGEPYYDGDAYARIISPDDWMNELIEGYDYVAISHLNDYFYENYSGLFEEPEDISENTVFRVDHDQRKLVLME